MQFINKYIENPEKMARLLILKKPQNKRMDNIIKDIRETQTQTIFEGIFRS